ncbi:MAG TPA: antibiotic biosynthesis monooxygenase family protein [Ktedonobacteraceae bacterium]|nr:antibiotic biosynthesis monooxygenase family protein [Ktedonobacteraceae bacterium]
MEPLLVLVEFGFTEEGEKELLMHLDRTLDEIRSIDGCLEVIVYKRPERLYLFYSLWRDQEAVNRWMQNEFHRAVLMTGFIRWANEGWFGYWNLKEDRKRVRKCSSCGRWSQAQPGWMETVLATCSHCGTPFPSRVSLSGKPGSA